MEKLLRVDAPHYSDLMSAGTAAEAPRISPRSIVPRRMHVVIVDEELPYPPNSGKRLRVFKLLIRLARRHRITYICHQNPDPQEARLAKMLFGDHKIETVMVDRTVPPKSGVAFYARLASNLFSPLPYSVVTHDSTALRQALQLYAANHQVDLWQSEYAPYARALRSMVGIRRLVNAHNVESLIWQRYYETEANPVKRWYIKQQWRKFKRFELENYADADRIIAVSAEDAALIGEQFGAKQVEIVENGVDTEYFRPTGGKRDPAQILFLGSLDWRPNLDAVNLMLDQVFPSVRALEPSAKLCLVGRNPPEHLYRRAASIPHVELHANVTNVRPHIAQSGLMAVPLRIGGGSRLKILEALASGLPVVSTKVGAEGLSLESGRHLDVVADIDGMAEALVKAIRRPGEALAQAEMGRQRVLERYDWDVLADKMEQIWIDCATAHS